MTKKNPTRKNPFSRFLAICMVLSLYAHNNGPVRATEDQQLTEIRAVVEGGAPGLALRIMDRQQAALKLDQPRWLIWERQRLEIYAAMGDWATLIIRVEQLPKTLPNEYRRWAMTQQAHAHHELKQGQQARFIIRHLLIASASQLDEQTPVWIQRWRRSIIQSYLADGLVQDAYTAIIRFQQDYPVQSEDLLLRAKVLLMSERPEEAMELLEKYRTKAEAAMLYLLAELRSQQQTPIEVIKAGLQQIRDKEQDKTVRTALWGVVAEAAQQAADYNNSVKALEHVLSESDRQTKTNLFSFNADSLWQAYMDYALMLGNKAQLLMGEDEQWLREAGKYHKKNSRKARAYYALLIRRGASATSRQRATGQFVRLLKRKSGEGERLILALFTKSHYYATNEDIPELVRHELVDIALARQDIPQASEMMATLNKPPKGNTSYMWYLRRARILVLGGQARKGAEVLKNFLQHNPDVNQTQIDRLLQVVFDLQTVKEHDAAYALFQQIIALAPDVKTQRELYYWMAESRKAQERYDEAAQLYLKSAFLSHKGLDPWGQTARYQAAEALGKAGLVDDAFSLFQQLLRTTKELDRRAVLRHEIEKLRLSQHNGDDGLGTND